MIKIDRFSGFIPNVQNRIIAERYKNGLQRRGLPDDYIEFINKINGGEGFVGTQYLILWRIEEIFDYNFEYQVNELAPGLFLIGSSGGGEGFGYDLSNCQKPLISVPFIGMNRDYIEFMADDLSDFFKRLELKNDTI